MEPVMPGGAGSARARGQTANSVVGLGKKLLGAKSARCAARHAERAAFASGRHFPQEVPTRSSRVRSRMHEAPPLTAARMCLSDTALQTHTIMEPIVNANANDCQ
jgi:hypothetical protein